MAKRMKKPCAFPMCPNTTVNRYCAEHKKRARTYDKDRGSASERGYDARWRRARRMFLARYPLCKECQAEGKTVAAEVVDHIVPHKGDYSLFWDEKNWQPLCKRHHDIKTVKEDGGFGSGKS